MGERRRRWFDDAAGPVVRPHAVSRGRTRCRRPIPVADLASDMDLPLGVVRVLIGDLTDKGLARVDSPEPSEFARYEAVLRMVLDELYSL